MDRLQNWQAVREALRFGQFTSVPRVPSNKGTMQDFRGQEEDVIEARQLEKIKAERALITCRSPIL